MKEQILRMSRTTTIKKRKVGEKVIGGIFVRKEIIN